MPTTYAWQIDKDHLAEPGETSPEIGLQGPSDAPSDLLGLLARGELRNDVTVYTFRMYDGDNECYYTGRLATTQVGVPDEDACYAPLGDYGMPGAGCTDIRYPRHPEMDCG